MQSSTEPDDFLVLRPHGAAGDAQLAPLHGVATPMYHNSRQCACANGLKTAHSAPWLGHDQGGLQAYPCSCDAEHQLWIDLSGFSLHCTKP